MAGGSFDVLNISPTYVMTWTESISSSVSNTYQLNFNDDYTRMIQCGNNGFQIFAYSPFTISYTMTTAFEHVYACQFSANNDYAVVRDGINI